MIFAFILFPYFWPLTEVVRKIRREVTPMGQRIDQGRGTPSVLAASDADKIFRSTAQRWFEITVRREQR